MGKVISKPKKRRRIQITPDDVAEASSKYLASDFQVETPKFGIYRWEPAAISKTGERLYRRKFVDVPTWVPIRMAAQLIEIPIKKDSIRRLALAEFIRSTRPTPMTMMIGLESLFEHFARMEAEPEFWHQPLNRQRWAESRKAMFKVDWKDEVEGREKSEK